MELLHYSFYTELLKNGAWLFTRLGGAPTNIFYLYQEENFSIEFAKYDFDESGQYDYENKDVCNHFEIDGIEVTKEERDYVVAKYFIEFLPAQWIVYHRKVYEQETVKKSL